MSKLYIEAVTNNAIKPSRATDHSACYDIYANLQARNVQVFRNGNVGNMLMVHGKLALFPGDRAMVPTGWKMCCDPGWKIEIAPRSGKAIKQGVTLINGIGIVDADFRHEAMILIINSGAEVVEINHEERIAQLSLEEVYHIDIVEGPLPKIESTRVGGMGSTG